jgi:hypothetical protein
MMLRSLVLASLALAALVTAGEAQQKKVKRDKKVITAGEVAEAAVNNAYAAVQKLRSDWLRQGQRQMTVYNRAGGGSDSPRPGEETGSMGDASASRGVKLAVMVDGTEVGGVEELQRIQSNRIEEMRFLNGSDAQQQYGSRYAAGLIQVRLKTS